MVWFILGKMTKLHLGTVLFFGLCALVGACSASGSGTQNLPGGGNTNQPPGAGGSEGVQGGSGGLDISITSGNGGGGGVTFRRPMVCDANGENCTCMNLASLGAIATYGAGDDNTAAFEDWLRTKSTAQVDFYPTRQTLTPDFLANYDVIILQDLRGWNFSGDELAAMQAWVEGGGGVISMIGYFSGDAAEIVPPNLLLGFTGMSYNGDDVPSQTCPMDLPMCPVNNPCCYCWGNSIPLLGWDPAHPISANIGAVGIFRGRSVNPGDGEVVVTDGSLVFGATKTVGMGKVFMYGDEWVTYTSQWLGTGVQNGNADQYNPCYDATQGVFKTGATIFQVPQFWYNAISYVKPPTECDFVIDEPVIILK